MFTSALSVNEFVLAEAEGVVTLGPVMGNSIHYISFDVTRHRLNIGEVKSLMRPLLDCYLVCLDQLHARAEELGANAVVGVQLIHTRQQPSIWQTDNVLIVKAIGTAVILKAIPHPARPILMAISGQEYFALCRAGLSPVGLVLGLSVYYQYAQENASFGRTTGRHVLDLDRMNPNSERPEYTRAVDQARHLAVRRMAAEAQYRNADGVIGLTVKMEHSWMSGNLMLECMVMGTAVVEHEQEAECRIAPMVLLNDR